MDKPIETAKPEAAKPDVKSEAAGVKSACLELVSAWQANERHMDELRETARELKKQAAELRDATIGLKSGQGRSHLGQSITLVVPTTSGSRRETVTLLQTTELMSGDNAKRSSLKNGRVIS